MQSTAALCHPREGMAQARCREHCANSISREVDAASCEQPDKRRGFLPTYISCIVGPTDKSLECRMKPPNFHLGLRTFFVTFVGFPKSFQHKESMNMTFYLTYMPNRSLLHSVKGALEREKMLISYFLICSLQICFQAGPACQPQTWLKHNEDLFSLSLKVTNTKYFICMRLNLWNVPLYGTKNRDVMLDKTKVFFSFPFQMFPFI